MTIIIPNQVTKAGSVHFYLVSSTLVLAETQRTQRNSSPRPPISISRFLIQNVILNGKNGSLFHLLKETNFFLTYTECALLISKRYKMIQIIQKY